MTEKEILDFLDTHQDEYHDRLGDGHLYKTILARLLKALIDKECENVVERFTYDML